VSLKAKTTIAFQQPTRLDCSDGIYVRVGGRWKYLFRAIDMRGHLIDFMLGPPEYQSSVPFPAQGGEGAERLSAILNYDRQTGPYPKAILRLKREGHLRPDVEHGTSKYLSKIIKADHMALKRMIRLTRGFRRTKTAYATLKGFEVMRMIGRSHCVLTQPGVTG
jgi:IS6 family transposase